MCSSVTVYITTAEMQPTKYARSMNKSNKLLNREYFVLPYATNLFIFYYFSFCNETMRTRTG